LMICLGQQFLTTAMQFARLWLGFGTTKGRA